MIPRPAISHRHTPLLFKNYMSAGNPCKRGLITSSCCDNTATNSHPFCAVEPSHLSCTRYFFEFVYFVCYFTIENCWKFDIDQNFGLQKFRKISVCSAIDRQAVECLSVHAANIDLAQDSLNLLTHAGRMKISYSHSMKLRGQSIRYRVCTTNNSMDVKIITHYNARRYRALLLS